MNYKLFLFFPILLAGVILTSCKREDASASGGTVYTCSMHPSVRMRDPKAKCPICGMNLVPVTQGNQTNQTTNTEFTVPVGRQQQIGVTYVTVEKRPLSTTLRAVGTVAYSKQRHWDYVSRVEGYVQKLHVASRGERVEQNQPLLTIYSPELLTTQREFLDMLRMRDQSQQFSSSYAAENSERMLESAKVRLRLWNIGE